MINTIADSPFANAALAGFGAYSCPHCGRDGLSSKHAPCPSCGQDIAVAHGRAGQEGMPEQYAVERGETGRSLADELKEQERKRLQPEQETSHQQGNQPDNGRDMDPRAAATALEAGMRADSQEQEDAATPAAKAAAAAQGSLQEMSASELEALRELQERDREVRSHEQAHISAGAGVVAGGASYSFEMGPDGRQYAVGGEVSIDTSPVPGDPDATMEKARTIHRAALAPASPSGQDRSVAARASQMEAEARMEKLDERRQEEEALDNADQQSVGASDETAPDAAALAAAALQPPSEAARPAGFAKQVDPTDSEGQAGQKTVLQTDHPAALQDAGAGEATPAGPAAPQRRFALPHGTPYEQYAAAQLEHSPQQLQQSGALQRKIEAIA